jgi:hypothetical protein
MQLEEFYRKAKTKKSIDEATMEISRYSRSIKEGFDHHQVIKPEL